MSPAGRRGERPAAEKINSLSLSFQPSFKGQGQKGKKGKTHSHSHTQFTKLGRSKQCVRDICSLCNI